MQYTDNEAALISGLISNYFLRPAVSAALKDSYIHVLEHLHAGRVSAADCENHKSSEMLPTYASAAFFYIFIFPCFCRDGLPVRFHRSFMLLLPVTLRKVDILSSPQCDLKIGGKLVLNLIFFTASVISILHDSPSVSVCFLANRAVYGGFLHRLGLKKRKKSQPVSSLHKKPAA